MRKNRDQSVLVPEEEQPYPIPDNWRWVRMGVLVNLYRGVSYKKEDAHSSKKENDVLILRGGNIAEGFVDIEADSVYVSQALVDKNQFIKNNDIIIVGSTGSKKVIGRAGIVDRDYKDVAFGAFLILARPNGMAHSPYVNYYFLSDTYRNRIRRMANGININNIRAEYITELVVPIPPIPEQCRIVEHIESLFSMLDEAKEKAQKYVDRFEARKAAILHRAFTGELTEEWRLEKNLSLYDWKSKRLEETTIKIIDGDRGKNYPKKDEFSPFGYCVFLNTGNVTKDGFSFEKTMYITEEKDRLLRSGRLERGDMIMTTRGTLGNTAIYDESIPYEHLRINSGMVIYRGGDEFIKKYLMWLYQSDIIKNQIETLKTGTAQPQIPIKVMNALVLPIPSIEEQIEIVRILDELIMKEQQIKALAESVINRIDTMKKAILARAFRGELGTNDPSEPPADIPALQEETP